MATRNAAEGHEWVGASRAPGLDAGQRVLMTLRVSRDSGRTWGRTIAVREGDPVRFLVSPQYPMCECRRCADSPAESVHSLRHAP